MQRFKIVESAVCRKMTREEMEYEEGGFWNIIASIGLTVAAEIGTRAGETGLIDRQTAKNLSISLTVASACLSFGVTTAFLGGSLKAATLVGKTAFNALSTSAQNAFVARSVLIGVPLNSAVAACQIGVTETGHKNDILTAVSFITAFI